MQTPSPSSRWTSHVAFARYVARRLLQSGHGAMATSARAAADAVQAAGSALDDARFNTQDAIADRDGADETLDEAGRDLRHGLASESRDAVKQPPYTAVFPEGIEYVTAAPLDQQVARYSELRARVETHLPAKHPLRKRSLDALSRGLAEWDRAVTALNAARSAEALKSTALVAAIDAFDRQMVRIYGTLLAEQGRASAERFFPRTRPSRATGAVQKGDPAT